MKKWILPLAVGVLLSAGCSTTSMKGTPFYSGEYEKREGPAADRFNLWPIVYYRDPALAVLWPLMEFSPEHQAVRPVYSAYDLDTDHPVYNVLWPLGRFAPAEKDYRFFPVYWGDDYFNVLPLYWHEGRPLAGTGHDALFPLWIWQNKERGNSLHLAWPFYARHRYDTWNAWHLWPVYGMKQTPGSLERDVVWPLIHSYTNRAGSGSWVIPAYAYAKTGQRSTFLSLPYSRSLAKNPGGRSWDLALPLWQRTWQGSLTSWTLFPALSWGRTGDDWSCSWYALGLGGLASSPDSRHHHLLPVYYYGSNPEATALYTLPWWWKKRADGSGFSAVVPAYYHGYSDQYSSFYSLPWMRKKYADGTGWNSSFPLYFYSSNPQSTSLYTLPWWMKKYADGSGWHALAPLYYRSYSDEGSAFYSLPWLSKKRADGSGWQASVPLFYRDFSAEASSFYSLPWLSRKKADGSGWDTTIPLYYRNYTPNSSSFYSPVWMAEKHPDGTAWKASFPFYYSARSADGSILVTPFYARKLHDDGSLAWRCYIPLVYVNEDYDAHFMTLLGGRWRLGDQENWMALPLLSGGAKNADSGRNIYLGGLAAQRWSETGSSHYVFPFYYRAPRDRTFVSLPYSTWDDDGKQNHVIPPLLSGWKTGDEKTRAILAAGLVGFQRGGPNDYSYVAPLYYASPKQGSFISLPYSAWRNGDDRQYRLLPPLLSGWYSEEGMSRGIIAAGLAGYRSGTEHPYHYVFPFYYSAPQDGSFYSLPYSTWGDDYRKNHLVLPLLSGWHTGSDSSGGTFALGLAGYRKGGAYSYSYVLPFYYAVPEEGSFLSLPYATWISGNRRNHAIPLLLSGWSQAPESTDYLLLGGLGYWRQGLSGTEGSHLLPFYLWEKDKYFYSAIYGKNRQRSYFATPLVGRYEIGSGKSGSWVFPAYWHKRSLSTDAVQGYYFPLGYYRKNENRSNHGFLGIYDYDHWTGKGKTRGAKAGTTQTVQETKKLHYLLSLGESSEYWDYEAGRKEGSRTLHVYTKQQSFFPLWHHRINDRRISGSRLETSSLLGILYDTRHEQESKEEGHDYFRRRVLWHLFHYEKLNGDMSTDIFPAITVDSYKNGYYKLSFMWRLFRYEKDPENGEKKLDVLFLPLKR